MADDIDIEEHDLLDDPRIKDIFPDVTKIKTEVLDINDPDNLNYDHADHTETESPRPRNKIILGSKPCGSSPNVALDNPLCFGYQREIKMEPVDDYDSSLEDHNTVDHAPIQEMSSVIILGSRSCGEPNDSQHNEVNSEYDDEGNESDIPDSIVYLEDWGPRLERSPCYCNECMILFPTRNCLDAHNSTAHSFLVAVEVNKAFKSTTKPPFSSNSNSVAVNNNTARKSTGAKSNDSRFCNHCNKLFDSHTELIKHLYENLTSGKIKCDTCDATFDDSIQLKTHIKTHMENYQSEDMYYRCSICGYVTKSKKVFDRHMSDSHDAKKYNYVKQKYNGTCILCNSSSEHSKHFNGHLKHVHPALFFKKASILENILTTPKKNVNINVAVPSTSKQKMIVNADSVASTSKQIHQCHVCKIKFNNDISLKAHVQSKHPQFCIKTPTTKSIEDEIPKTAANVNPANFAMKQLIPKNSLFKCNRCNTHFTNPGLALTHTKTCKNIRGDWTCDVCGINFSLSDRDIHIEQHTFGDSFRVHPIDEDIYKKILCKCPDCNSYLDEPSFWQHCKGQCDSNITVCNICDWYINDKCLKQHEKIHKQFNIVNEFLRITYKKVVIREKTNAKRTDITFIYCSLCGCVLRGKRYIELHKKAYCLNDRATSIPHICKMCGLKVRSNRHDDFHNANPNVKISDMKFVRISDNKVIPPPIPDYPKCQKCNVCFLSNIALNKHDCIDNFRTCHICKEKFSDLAYKLHMPFHGKQNIPQSKNSMANKIATPKLIEKNNIVSKTWNFLYLCYVCDIMTDSYDKVVEHCQNHYNNLENYDVTIKLCDICDYKFDSPCYENHKNNHLKNKSVIRQSFKVFGYDYHVLFNNDRWLELFKDIPSTDIDNIISNSIYRYVRTLKMKILSQGSPEFTVYKCEKCQRFVNPPMAIHHYHSCKGNPIDKGNRCIQCNVVYSSKAGLQYHMQQHTDHEGLKIRIVSFNSYEDAEFNNTLVTQLKTQPRAREIGRTVGKIVKKKVLTKKVRTFLYYKCFKCKCCTQDPRVKKHVCKEPKHRNQCNKCKLWFSMNMHQHIQRHKNWPNFRVKVLPLGMGSTIVETIPEKVASPQSNTKKILYKCICDLHFTTQRLFDEHIKDCDAKNPVSSENCSKCSLKFPTSNLVNHLVLHHANNKCTEFETVTVKWSGILHRCGKCDVTFSDKAVLKSHYDTNHYMDFEVKSCCVCNLKLPVIELEKHEDTYHTKTSYIKVDIYKPEEFVLESSQSVYMAQFTKDLVRLDMVKSELVKCSDCKAHFLSYSRFYRHVTTKGANNKMTECDVCGLIFEKHVLPVHRFAHHEKMGLNAEDFDIRIMTVKNMHNHEPMSCLNDDGKDEESKVDKQDNIKEDNDETTDTESNKIEVYKSYTKYLFKCDICLVHLLTTTSLNKHQQFCGTLKQKTCSVCKLNFFERSLNKHIKIHHDKMKLRKRDFVVNDIYGFKGTTTRYQPDNVSGLNDVSNSDVSILNDSVVLPSNKIKRRTLYTHRYVFKCAECSIRFLSEGNLLQHIFSRNHDDLFRHCNICNAKYSTNLYTRHMTVHHKILKLQAEDISVVSCYKHGDSIVSNGVYKCHRCEVCFTRENSFIKHIQIGCQRSVKNPESCDTCNLYFSHHSLEKHKQIQHGYLKLGPDDIVMIEDDTDISEIKKPGNEIAKRNAPKISSKTIPRKYLKAVVSKTFTKSISAKFQNRSVNSNKISKIIYKCDLCNLCFLKFSTLRSHFESDHPGGIIQDCDICHQRFLRHVYSNHKHYHHQLAKFSRKDIVVHVYNTESLASRTPKVVTSKKQMREEFTISESTKAKMRSMVHKLNTLYKCRDCGLHLILKATAYKHRLRCKTKTVQTVKCDECNLEFSAFSLAKHKYIHHEYLGLKTLKVLTVGDTANVSLEKSDSNETVAVETAESIGSVDDTEDSIMINSDEESTADMDDKPENECKLYRCSRCNLCFLNNTTLEIHVNANHPSSSKVSCSICYNNFTNQTLQEHTRLHHTIGKFTKDNITIVNDGKIVSPKPKKTPVVNKAHPKKIATPYQGKIQKIYKKYIISKHTKKELRANAVDIVFKCKLCGMTFVTHRSVEVHLQSKCSKKFEPPSVSEKVCDVCDLKFTLPSYAKHYYVHHEYLGLTKEDLNVVLIDENNVRSERFHAYSYKNETPQKRRLLDDSDQVSVKSDDTDASTEKRRKVNIDLPPRNQRLDDDNDQVSVKSDDRNASTEKRRKIDKDVTTLYKCSECKVYYLSKATCLKHVHKHEKLDEMEFVECKACSLPFPIMTYRRHVLTHHSSKSEFKLEDILIEEYTPRADGKLPEPDIFFAVDKVQSKLVSTTTDRDDCIEVGESSGTQSESSKMIDDEDSSSKVRLVDLISFEDD